MKITHPLLTKSLGLFGATMIRGLTATLDYRIVYEDPLADPIHPRRPRHAIYLLWHEYLMFPLGLRGKGLTVLISQHRDGELIAQVMRHLGFRAVRGSSTRGGVRALKQILKGRLRNDEGGMMNDERKERREQRSSFIDHHSSLIGNDERGMMNDERKEAREGRSSFIIHNSSLIVTPDGPRGPRRRLAEGSIFLASRLQMPIVCMGFAFERPWRQKSWDRFAIPRPFSRGRAVISGFIEIPPNLTKQTRRPRNDERGMMNDEQKETRAGRSSFIDHHSSLLGNEERGMMNEEGKERKEQRSSFIVHHSSLDLEYWRLQVEQILNQVTGEAESWAESGRRKPGEMPILRHQPAPQMTA